MKRTGLVLISLIICCCTLAAQSIAGKLDALVSSEKVLTTSEVGISVFNLTQGKQVYAYQDKKLYRPASIEKVITSVTALESLENIIFSIHGLLIQELSFRTVYYREIYI